MARQRYRRWMLPVRLFGMKIPIKIRVLRLAAALLCACIVGQAQAERWASFADPVFFNLSTEQGLPFGRVSAVARDKDGFVWLVTSDGLIRWDGYAFQALPSGIADIDNDIRTMKADEQGRLWLGTGRGLYCFDPGTGEVERFHLFDEESFAVIGLELQQASTGLRLWLGTERGVFEVDALTGAVTHHLADEAGADLTMRVFAVVPDAQGGVWAGTSKGLYRRHKDEQKFQRVALQPLLPDNTRISDLLLTRADELWFGTPRNGVFAVRTDDQVVAIPIAGFEGEWIYSMEEVADDLVWLGTYGKGVIEVSAVDGGTRRMRHNPLLKHSLSDDVVWTVSSDGTGLVWVGTAMGLSILDLKQVALKTAFGGSNRPTALRDRGVKSLLETQNGQLWVGLRESGVDVIDPAYGRVATIDVDPGDAARALPGGAIETMAQVANGDIYIGSNWGLYRHANSRLRRMQFEGRDDLVFTGALMFDGSKLWAGGTDGLWQLALDGPRAVAAQVASSVNGAFTDPRISTMASGPDGHIAVGTWEGINWVDSEGKVVQRIPAVDENPSPLENGYVTSVLTDVAGRTWIGTSGAGIYVNDGGDLRQIGREDGLPSDVIASLQLDEQGRVWASTNSGIAVIRPDTLGVVALGPADGALVAPYYRQPGLTTSHGEILFGGEGGLTIIDPNVWAPSSGYAPLAITSVRLGGEFVPNRQWDGADGGLVVPADQNAVSLEFAALDFLSPRSIRYRHRLEGYDTDWHETDADRRTATYTLLPPGEYELQVQASNRQGIWGGEFRQLRMTVMPYWYQTQWARWAGIAATAVMFYLLFRWRTAQLRRHRDVLEGLVQERTRDLEVSAEALRAKSAELETASMTDPLTGMHNRRFLDKHMPADQALVLRRYADAPGQQLQLADLVFFVVDIDHFKTVNDVHGHAAGDRVLTAMRERLSREFRESDYLVRWGGEEFLVVARAASRDHAGSVAERIRLQVHDEPFDAGHGIFLNKTCSIGYCALPFDIANPRALNWLDCVRLADLALYAAKRAGRNAWVGVSAGPDLVAASLMRQIAENPVAALSENRICLTSNLEKQSIESAWLAST